MHPTTWTNVDNYFADALLPDDAVLRDILAANAAAGLPAHDVSPLQGQFLHLLVRIQRAERVLEIGTLGAYSTVCLARALPAHGRVVTLEANPAHAAVARENLRRAGVADRVDLREGRAIDTLPTLEPLAPFDLVFIDADKPSNCDYFAWALRLTRPGSVIVADNVVRDGRVIDAVSEDANVRGVRRFVDMLRAEPRVSTTALQTVGVKGYDGFLLAWVN